MSGDAAAHVVKPRTRFTPDVETDARGRIVTCRETGRCSSPGRYCEQLAACEVLDARCAALFADGCDGACSRCKAAVTG